MSHVLYFVPLSIQDERFNQEVDAKTGYRTKSLLCMAIKDKRGDVLGVAQVRVRPQSIIIFS